IQVDGELQVALLNGFTPDPLDEFVIVDVYSLSDTSRSERIDIANGNGSFLMEIIDGLEFGRIILSDYQSADLVGDYNGDGSIDAADYNIWRSTYNSTLDLRADGNGNGVVDAADYTIWRDQFGASPAELSGQGHVVPEPVSVTLLLAGLVPLLRHRTSKIRSR
ncbi:MAG: hypothetical protein MI741_05915, partial [Rhodospirillales bacterium]|nr:hypothetical protein [Rhodospirillales bacterium]